MDNKEELLNDFKLCLDKMDFTNYNPNSGEFRTALFLGLMYSVLSDLEDETEEDEISDEIKGAKHYLQKYIDSKDSMYNSMARDEIKHAENLIKKAKSKLLTFEMKDKIKGYENQITWIMDKLNN